MATTKAVRSLCPSTKKILHLLIVALVAAAGLGAWAASHPIFMDGRFDDWQGLAPLYQDASGDQGTGDIDFTNIWICNDADRLFIRFQIGSEHNLQNNNSIYLYIDSDNNPATGYYINGIGADFSIAFGERQGRLYNAGTELFNLNQLGMLQSPTVSATEFEIALARNATYNSTPFFSTNIIKLQLVNNIAGSHDQAPDTAEILSYTFDETPVPPYGPIPLSKENSTDIRVLTYNVKNDGLFSRTETFTRILQALQPDILNFQEIFGHSASETATLIGQILGGAWYAAKSSHDCVTVSKYPILNYWEIETDLAVLIYLPDASYPKDIFIINSHLPAGDENEQRQQECDSIMAFIRDFTTPGGIYDLPSDTPILLLGDLNLVGYAQQLTTLLTGDIVDEAIYGPDFYPDWDASSLTDVLAYHTATRDSYTWRNDTSSFCPGRLDYIIYTDSVIEVGRHFTLWTETMSPEELTAYGLQASDSRNASDHLPVVTDFRFPTPTPTPTPTLTPTPTPDIVSEPGTLDFGQVLIGSTKDLAYELWNQGDAPLEVTGLGIMGDDAAQFSFVSPPSVPLTIAPETCQTIDVRFEPTRVCYKSAYVETRCNDPDEAPFSLPTLQGKGRFERLELCEIVVNDTRLLSIAGEYEFIFSGTPALTLYGSFTQDARGQLTFTGSIREDDTASSITTTGKLKVKKKTDKVHAKFKPVKVPALGAKVKLYLEIKDGNLEITIKYKKKGIAPLESSASELLVCTERGARIVIKEMKEIKADKKYEGKARLILPCGIEAPVMLKKKIKLKKNGSVMHRYRIKDEDKSANLKLKTYRTSIDAESMELIKAQGKISYMKIKDTATVEWVY